MTTKHDTARATGRTTNRLIGLLHHYGRPDVPGVVIIASTTHQAQNFAIAFKGAAQALGMGDKPVRFCGPGNVRRTIDGLDPRTVIRADHSYFETDRNDDDMRALGAFLLGRD